MNHLIKIFGLREHVEKLGNKSTWPLRSQAVKYDLEILTMTKVVTFYQNNDIITFEKILKTNHSNIMDDSFLRGQSKYLSQNIQTRVSVKLRFIQYIGLLFLRS